MTALRPTARSRALSRDSDLRRRETQFTLIATASVLWRSRRALRAARRALAPAAG